MAKTLWGKVYFKDKYVGRLQEEPGGRVVFTYDASYLEAKEPAIAHTLPLRAEPYISESGLHSFFDNLVAEGWLQNAQAKVLGVNPHHRLSLIWPVRYLLLIQKKQNSNPLTMPTKLLLQQRWAKLPCRVCNENCWWSKTASIIVP